MAERMSGAQERGWLASGPMSEDEKRKAEAQRLGVPFVILNRGDISLDSLVLIPEPLSRTANVVAYSHGEEGIEVALLDLADLPSIDFLRQSHRVQVRLTDRASIKQALLIYQKHLKEKFAGMVQGGKEAAESLVKHALHSGAHYVHMEPAHAEAAGMVVRYRIEGALREAMRLPEAASKHIVERLKNLAKLFPVSTTVQEGSFAMSYADRDVGVAVSTMPTVGGERLTMRLAHDTKSVTGFSLSALGLHGDNLEQVQNALHAQKGIVLVAGMSDSGKTTMLYTMLDHVTAPHKSVATIEEVIEYRLPQVHQAVTRPDVGMNAAALLRATLRQDPDAVMMAAVDGDTLSLVVRAAERGVFMIGGIEARSAAHALDIVRGEGSMNGSETVEQVKLVVGVRLLRRLTAAATKRQITRGEADVLEGQVRFAKVLAALKQEGVVHEHTAWKDVLFYTANDDSEYQGRVGVQEVLEISERGQSMGLTMLEDSLFKSVQGLVSIEDVVAMAAE